MDLTAYVDREQPALLADLERLVSIPSVAGAPRGEGAPYGEECRQALDAFLSLAARMGFETVDVDGHAGWCQYGQGEEMVAVVGHLDVVPAGEGWHYPPYAVTRVEDRLYGRGVVDDKGPVVAALYALKAVKDSGAALKRRVRILVGCNEENGCSCIAHYVAAGGELPAAGFTPDGAFPIINGEKAIIVGTFRRALTPSGKGLVSISGGTAHNVVPAAAQALVSWPEGEEVPALGLDGVSLERTQKGLLVQSVGRSTHGSTPELGENAVGRLLLALNRLGLDGSSGEAVSFLARRVGMETRGESLGIARRDGASGDLTVNLGIIRGDGQGVECVLDLRSPVTLSGEETARDLTAAMAAGGFEQRELEVTPSLYTPPDSPLVQALLRVYEEQTGRKGELLSIGGGTYAKSLPNLVAFGPTFPEEEMTEHQPDEYINLETLMTNAQLMAAAIAALAGEN